MEYLTFSRQTFEGADLFREALMNCLGLRIALSRDPLFVREFTLIFYSQR